MIARAAETIARALETITRAPAMDPRHAARRLRGVRALVTVGIVVALLAGCDEQHSASENASGSRSAGGERERRARRDMGLSGDEGETLAESLSEEEEGFDVGDVTFPALPDEVSGELLRDGLHRAALALRGARPEPDPAADAAELQEWAEAEYAEWLRARGESLRDARTALAPAEDGHTGDYVVASAVIGVLFARLAEAVATMPMPEAVAQDPGERLRFRDAFLRTAAPLMDRAADAFGACVGASTRTRDHSLDRWQRFCDERLAEVEDMPRPIE